MDADVWRRILCSKAFNKSSQLACDSIARMCRRLCTEYVDPTSISAILSCRLIPLDKNPGVRPIGIGEVLRRIIGKTVTTFLKIDIINSVGPLQLAAGQEGGCESAIHGMEKMFEDDQTQGVLLVDASNAFNCLNRKTSLLNIPFICPEFAVFIINTYRLPSRLFLPGGTFILSNEGTTQGDNCASGFYSLSILPIILQLSIIKCRQLWYADDAAAVGVLLALKEWWDMLLKLGPGLGYFPNAAKTWLVVKPQHEAEAIKIFKGTGVQITTEGQSYLGAAIGSTSFKNEYVSTKVQQWVSELEKLAEIAKMEPQLAYAAYTFGLSKRWMFVMRTMDNISELLQPLEECIQTVFLPTLIQNHFNDAERRLFTLPAKFGGLSIFNPSEICQNEFNYSCSVTAPLVETIMEQKVYLSPEENYNLNRISSAAKNLVSSTKVLQHQQKLKYVKIQLGAQKAKHIELLCKKGASAWLTSLPLEEFGFVLNKQEFTDAISLRYNLPFKNMSTHCACGAKNSLDHALICKKRWFCCNASQSD